VKPGPDAGANREIMAKFFAVTIIVIAIASAIPIVRHTWPAPEDISLHGHLIDEQMSETMAEAGISFLAAQFVLAIFIWKFSDRPKDAKIGKFPGGAKGLVIAAFLLVGTEVLALGVFGTRAWASVYFTPPSADSLPIQVQAGQFAFYFRYPGADGKFGPLHANLINEAAILCAQVGRTDISLAELEMARDKVRFGKERKSMVLKKKEREMVAHHEAGHTIIHLKTSLLPPLYKVSIVPRGTALGVTTLLPDEDQNLQSKKFLLEELLVLMGGRAAEKTFYDSTTNGAAGDLDMARKVARKMIHEWGMGEKLYYELDQKDAEVEINRLLENADRQAHELILSQKENTAKLAQALLTQETLTRDEVLKLLDLSPSAVALAVN